MKKFYFIILTGFLILNINKSWAQIALSKSVDQVTADPGTPFTYTIQINCPGTSGTCSNVVVTDLLSSNLDFLAASSPTGNVQSVNYNSGSHEVTITMNPTLNGTSDEVQIVAAFKNYTPNGTVANNTAQGTGGIFSNTVSTTLTNGFVYSWANTIYTFKNAIQEASEGNGVLYTFAWANSSQTYSINNLEFTEVIPAEMRLTIFSPVGFRDASGIFYNIYYKTNLNSSWTLGAGGSYDLSQEYYLSPDDIGVPIGEYVTELRFNYLQPIPGGGQFFQWLPNFHEGRILGYILPGTPIGSTVNNCVAANGVMNSAPINVNSCANVVTSSPTQAFVVENEIENPKSGYLAGDTLTFNLFGGISEVTGLDQINPTVIGLLPPELDYISYTSNEMWGNPFGGTNLQPTFTKIDNYLGTGQTFLRFKYNYTVTRQSDKTGKTFRVQIKAKIKSGVPSGTYQNRSYQTSELGGEVLGSLWWDWYDPALYGTHIDINNMDGDGFSNDTLQAAYRNFNVVFPSGAGLEAIQFVKGTNDNSYKRYPVSGNSSPGGKADVKLVIKNSGNVALKDIKIIDILPYVGDSGVIDLSARSSQWRPFLIDTIVSSVPTVQIFYSTADKPCRDQLTPGIPSPCDAPAWSLTPPSDITTVQSLKFDFGTQVMAPGDSIVIQWPMRVPINTSITGQPAWNSFGYIATRNDNNSVLLPSEPIKVGIESNPVNPALIGNYIWYDNNANGIQDEGTANGQNNLRVDLFQKLGAIRNPLADSLITYTLSSNSGGNPGYYQFSNIPNGNYYVAVHLPTHYIGTLANAGGNDNLDSDGSLLVNISGDSLLLTDDIVVTGAESVYMGFDLGIHPICDSPISATASVNSPICDGGTANFTGGSVGGTSFSWTGPNGFTSGIQNPTLLNVSPSEEGIYTLTVNDGIACSATATVQLTLTPDVSTPVFSLGVSSTRCQGNNTVTYTATAANSTSIAYTLDATSLAGGNTINASTGQVTYAAGWSGTSTITATAAGCNGPAISSHTVTITPTVSLPVFASGATSTRCQGVGSVTYSATAANSTGITYTLDATSLAGGNTINGSTGQVTYSGTWSGTTTITASAAGCNGPAVSTHVVTITPTVGNPVFALGATSNRCQGAGSVTYSATSSNSTGITYSLDALSLGAGNTINSSTGEVTWVAGWTGSSIITATSTGCNGPVSSTHTVSNNGSVQSPVFSLGATSVRCQGATTVTYSATATNATGITYSLDALALAGGNTINSSTGAVTYVAGWTGTTTITATASGCNGPTVSTHVVTITPTVSLPVFASGSTSTRCQGAGNVTYTASATNTTGITYSLDATSLTGGNTINASTGEVTYSATWSGTSVITASAAGCNGPRTATHTVTVTPTVGIPVFSLGATSTRCQGAGTVSYGATASNSTGISYSLDALSLAGGNTINSSTGAVTWVAGWTGSSVITATATGCNGPSSSNHTVTVTGSVATPVFALGAISTRCQGAGTITYSATATNSSGITYSLDLTSRLAGNTIVAATGAVTFVAGWTGTSTVTATATGCNGPTTSTHTITITPSVGTPSFVSGSSSTRCQGAGNVTYTANATNSTGITYSLDATSLAAGNTINASSGEVTYIGTWSGTSTITASAAGCNGPRTANHTVTVTPSVTTPVFSLGSNSVRCQGNTNVIYTATVSNSTGLTYSLDATSLAAGNTINSSNGRVNYSGSWVGTSYITATATGCNGPTTAVHEVTTNSTVATPVFALGATSTRCQGIDTVTYTATASYSTGIVYSLNAASISAGNTINSATGEVIFTAGWTGTSIITATASGCNGPKTATHTVSIIPTVGTPVFALGNTSGRCQGVGSVIYSASASNNTGITYELDLTSILAGNTINPTTGEVTYVAGWFGTSEITATATGCNGPKSTTHFATTGQPVEAPIFLSGNSSIRCQGAGPVSYGATATNSTGITYSLDITSRNAGNTINSSTGVVTFVAGWSGSSTVTASAAGCAGPLTSTHNITTTPTVGNPVFALGNSSTRCIAAGSVTYSASATNSTETKYYLDNTSQLGGNTIDSLTGEVIFAPGWFGTSTITVTVWGCNGPKSANHIVTTNQAVLTPVFSLGASSVRCQGNGTVTYMATAANSTGISYSLDASSLAGGNTINSSTGAVTFSSTWTGTSTVTATATGCYGPTQQTHTITITPSVSTPIFSLGSTSIRCQGSNAVTYTATATNFTSLIYSLDGLSISGGNTINSSTGEVTFSAGWSGTSVVTATVTGCSGPKSSNHNITVTPTVGLPIFSLGAGSTRCQGAGTATYSATATNNTGITYSLDATSLLAGNTINPSTGQVTFVNTWTGLSTVTASATGCNGPRMNSHNITTIYIEAFDDNATGLQGSPTIIQVLNNDLGDVDPTKISIASQPNNGFIQIASNGEITYLPNGNFYGVDQFTYTVCSGGSSSCCSQATVFLQIDETLNDPCSEATKSKTYYLPFPENTNFLRQALWNAGDVSYLTDSARTVLSIKIPYPGNIISYDHWEDGYESDITIPIQLSTEIWGDGILNNGVAPGYPTDIIPAGGYILIDNHFIYNPRDQNQIYYDGKDKILSSSDIAISKISGDAGSATGSNNFDVQNLKTNVFDITRFGKFFVVPFGEDVTLGGTSAFKFTGLFVRASKNGTIVNLDLDGDGLVDLSSPTMNEGDVIYYNGTASTPGLPTDVNLANDIKSGAILTSNNDFGVDVVFGGIDHYGTRNMALLPGNYYGDTYFSPAHTTNAIAPVFAFFTNNLATPITIDWTSGTGATGSFVVAGKSNNYLDLNQNAGYRFKSRNGEAYTAVAVFDADATGLQYDWSFNMIPESRLSTFASVAWAPGSSNGTANYNPVWVTAPTATTLYIKFDGNLATQTATLSPCGIPYDIAVPVSALQSYRIFDTSDNDQTGLAVYTCDGTKIAAVWGQDPSVALPGSPGMDVGYVLEPRCLQQLIIANDDLSDTEPDTPVIIEVQNNDYGFLCTPDKNSLSTLGLLQPSNGIVIKNTDGTVTYTPNTGFQGTDYFEYRVCSAEYPSICDVAIVTVRVSTCIANPNENLFRGKVFVEASPDDATYNGEMGAAGVQVDLYIDANCNGIIDIGEGITESTVSDIGGRYSFSTQDGNNARDNFDPTAAFNGNDGGLLWNNNWTESGDDGSFSSGDIRVTTDASTGGMGNAIRLSGPSNGISRSLTFNNTVSALLKFSYRRQSLDRQGEGVSVLINGTTVFTLNDGQAVGTDLNYTNVYLPLSAYNANGVNTLQFITNGSVSTDDYFWIDNVELSYYRNPPICYVAKVNTASTLGAYSPSLLDTQTATFNVLGVCDKDNYLGVIPHLVATDDNAFTTIDNAIDINVIQNEFLGKPDTSLVSFTGVSIVPAHGTVSVNQDGTIRYIPNPGYFGTDQFEYRVCSLEDSNVCDIALVNVTVSCASSPLSNAVTGTVFVDGNSNGLYGLGETGYVNAGVNLILDQNNNGVPNVGEPTVQTTLTDSTGYYEFHIDPPTNSLNYLDQFNFSGISNQSNGSTSWTNSWIKIGEGGTFSQNNIQISSSTGLQIQSSAGVVSGAYRSLNLNGALSATMSVSFNEQNLELEVNDYVDLQIANSASPSSWHLLKRFTGADGNQTGSISFDISDYISSATTIRFVTSGSTLMVPGDVIYFDNVQVDYLQPVAANYVVQLTQPIPTGYSLTTPLPNPTGYYAVGFASSGQGECNKNFGLAVTDLAVTKIVDNSTPYVGDTVTFTITATNNGPTSASNVVVSDVVPSGYNIVAAASSKGTWVGNSWNVGYMNNGDTENLQLTTRVVPSTGYINIANIAGDQADVFLTNNTDSASTNPTALIDLALDLSTSNANPNVGDVLTFTIDLTNADYSPATGIIVKSVIPNGFGSISSISDGGSIAGNEITWNLASLSNNTNNLLTYQATVLAPGSGVTYNTLAQVTAANELDFDSTPNNNVSSEDDQDTISVVPQVADLRLTNQISSILPNVGDVVTYTVTVYNDGPDAATNVDISNVIDNGFNTITNISGGGILTGNTIEWNIGSLLSGQSRTFTYQATVLAPGPGIGQTNIAQVSASDQFDPDSSPNNNLNTEDDQAEVTALLQGANLSLLKSINDSTPNIGDIVTFSIVLSNSGPDAATNVSIEDVIPNGYSLVSNISNSGILTGNTINWNIPNLSNGSNITLTYQATVNAPVFGINFTNTAQITASDQFDPNSTPSNDNPVEDDQSSVTSVPRVADLALTKSVNNPAPQVGEVVTFTIEIQNFGPDSANFVSVKDTIPNGYTNISNITGGGILTGNVINWNFANIPFGINQTVTYEATVLPPLPGVIYTNIAQVSASDEFDPNSTPNNNNFLENDQDGVTVDPKVADLSIIKQINNINPLAGDMVTFTITLSNSGPDTASNIVISDKIPNGYSGITNITGGGNFVGDSITWFVPSLAIGQNEVFTYQATVLQSGAGISHTNIVQVQSVNEYDPNSIPGNGNTGENDQDEVTAVPQQANLSLIKTSNTLLPDMGDTVTFFVKIKNAGPFAATNVYVRDSIPNGYSNIMNVSHSGTMVGSNLEWYIANIPNGDSVTVTYQIVVAEPDPGINFTNIAQITGLDQFDPNSTPGNNNPAEDDQSQVTLSPTEANISLVKTVSNIRPNVGDVITFILTLTNAGPDTATGIDVEDIMPNGYSNITNISHGGTRAANILHWNNLTIPNAGTLVLTYQATVLPIIAGRNYNNIAQLIGLDQHDPDSTPGNDNPAEDDQDEIIVSPRSSDISLVKVVSDANPNVGDTITYTVKVYNAGPDTATNIVAGDFLPNGLINIRNISASGVYAGDSIVWNIASIVPADSIVLTYQATVAAPGFGVTFNNIAQILDVDQFDPNSTPGNDNPAENDQDEITIVPQVANITLTKSVNNIRPNVGDVVTFTIALANAGPDTATGVAVEDIMPNGFNNIINISNGGLLSGSTINWTGLSVPANDTLLLTYQATVLPLLPGNNYNNIAQITDTDQHDPDSTPGNDNPAEDDQDEIIVSPRSSDISLVKVVSDANPNVGDTITYTVKVYNAGPDTATNIVAGDFLPNGLINIRNISASGVYAGDSIVWNIASIVPADSIVLTYQATVAAPGFGVTFNNIAQILDVDQFDPNSTPGNDNPAENDQDEITIVPQVANITLTKSVNNIRPNVGDVVTFTIALANVGPDTATGVAVEDIMPNGFNNIINISNGGLLSGSTINWTGLSVPANDTLLLTYQATVLPLLPGNNYNNIAQITDTDQHDPDSTPGNDNPAEDDQDEIIVSPRSSDISLVKVVSDANPNVGDTIIYTVKVYNAGPDTATNIVAGDFLPNGLTNIRNISASGEYAGDSIVWNIASIDPADSIVLTYQATVAAPGFGVTFNNIAQILDVDQYDPNSTPGNDNPAENDQDEITIVPQVANITLTKSVNNIRPNVEDVVTFTIALANAGPDTATGVAVEDIMPNGFNNTINISNGGLLSGSTINWTGLSVPANDTLLLTYQATVLPLLPGNNYNNIAQITDTDQHDPDSTPGNDNPAEDDQDEIIVSPRSSDISLVKVVSDANPNVGDTITYTVKIYNAGPDTATNIVAGDFLPNGLTNIRNISASGVYASDSIVWNIASIVPADSIVLTYQATVAAPGFGVTFNNIAQIHDVDQFDPNSTPGNDNPAENDQDEITIVPQVANITLTKSVNNIRPNVGDVVTFTIALANAGPDSATGVAVEDIMPNGFNNIINISNGGLLSGSTINWTGLSVPANDTILLTYQATVLPLLPGNNYNNIAQITDTDQHDPDSTPGNDNPAEDDQDEIIVSPRSSDISLVKVVSDANPNVGDTITYTVKIYNAGPDTATNIVAGDFLPNGLSNIRNISASGVYAGDSIVWNIASIVPADSIVLTYQATVAAPGFGVTFNNIAQILEVDQYDPNSTPGNDNPAENDQDEVNILSKVADISLVKTADLTTPIVGDTVNYTITIINAGPDTATNVAVNDIIPNGLGSIMNINNGGVLNISNINWNIVSIAANDTVFLNYSGIVQQPVSGVTYLNTAEITSSDQFDPNSTPGNGVTTEDDYDEQNLIVDSSVPVANAGADFNKTCIINPSGRTIGEASQVNHSYSWYPSTGLSDTTISNPVANPLVTTTYYVTKTNLNNLFFDVDTITVTVNTTIPSISAGADFTISCSQNPTGNFIGEVSQAGHSYAWTPSSGLSSAVISRPMARPSVTTTYYMSKTRIANGCVGYDTITVTVDTLKPIAAISGIDTITCAKTSVMRVASGGVTYAWSDGLGTNDSVNISSPGTYNVTVTATNGCTSTASVEVFRDIVVPVVNISGMDTLFVTGQTVARVASGASTYSWSAGLGTSDSVNISIPGTYTVTGTALNGCTATASTTVLQMIYGSIGDQVWRDDNQNGKFDLGESGLPNVKLYLADTSGIILDSVLTDSNGKYLFDSLLAGEYLVKVQIPSGFIFTNNNSVSADSSSDSDFDRISGFSTKVTVSAAYPRRHLRRDNTEIDAGFIKVGTIRDMVWEDTNRNGIKDSTETGISGVTVRIYDYSNNLISSKTTDSTGNFEFDSLTIGQYYVSFVKPLLYEAFTLKNQGLDSSKDSDVNVLTSRTDLITISSAGNEEIIKLDSADAGLMLYEKSIIGDFVWNDLNGNGIQEIGEPGLDSINVTLTGITYLGDTININTLTDSLGKYYFTNIDPGTYQINVDLPSGFAFAPENQEITDTLDSDIINAFGDSSPIVITGGQNLDNVDAAQYQFSTLSGIVWNDDDRDGLQVLTESPMPNTTVYLTGVTGSGSLINLSTISDSNGLFNFDSLAPGQYSVSILKPSGFVYSPTDSGSDDNLDSDINAGTGISTNYTITSGEINNSVGIGIFAQIPEITLVKTGILSGKGFVGDTINYTFTVTNTGENTLRNIYIIDSLLNASPITLSPDSLLAGQSGTATGSYILTPTDIIRGSVSNSAIVYGTDPEGDLVSDISDDNNPANPGLNDTTVVTIPKVDFALSSNIIGTCEVAIGDTVTYQVVVTRQDTMSLPSAVIISDSLPSTVSFVSATTTNGTFNSATGVWDNLSLSSGQSDTLTIRARVLTQIGGLMCNIAYIDSSEYNDVDSNPGNQVSTEDDYTKSCKSLPINICVSKGETTTLSTTTGHTTYQWQRNGVDIPGANTSSVTISAAGDYTVIIDGQACISGCCPIIVQDSCYCPPAICVPLKITKTR